MIPREPLMIQQIPHLIHQTWRDRDVPDQWRGFQASWRRCHPKWEYRLWTDLNLRELICDHYPWFLPIYDNYPETIQRVDAARYFLMHKFGGIYADLDFECLKPMDPLVDEREVVFAYEPGAHLGKSIVKAHGLEQVIGNAFMASRPNHAFWEHVFLELVGAHRLPGPLATTGPFLLTRALKKFRGRDSLTCLPSEVLYPGTSEDAERGLLTDHAWRQKIANDAFAIHHWSGSWFSRAPAGPTTVRVPLKLIDHGKMVLEGNCVLEQSRGTWGAPPSVSCLMVTTSARIEFAKTAIACFQAQTYSARELVIVDDGNSGELERYQEGLADPRISYVRLKPEGKPLGCLRNIAVSNASGEYVMQWDDDDLYHPRRIETQMAALQSGGGEACLLSRWKIWWPLQRRLAVSKSRGWEGSILCAKRKLPRYDESLSRGEDTYPILQLVSREKVVFIDAPWLYTYVVHASNTTSQASLEEHWAQATKCFWGERYASELQALGAELPEPVRGSVVAEFGQTRPSVGVSPVKAAQVEQPRVLILSPVKDGASLIENYISSLLNLDYPLNRISLALLESDSVDGTFQILASKLSELRQHLERVELFKRDYHFRPALSRSHCSLQLQRRSILARSRNYLLSRALRDEEWVLWLDFDVIEYPKDLIQQLLSKGKDILVPNCVLAPGGRTFDLNTFVQTPGQDLPGQDVIAQPPKGLGREYLDAFRDRDLVEVDAVGGTVLLIKADRHREGLVFPAVPYKKYIETEGLSYLARDMGISSWGAPDIEVIHANR